MTPERRAASRLGWVGIMGAMVANLLALILLATHAVWWVTAPIGAIAAIALVTLEPTLYRWVTAPERETNSLG